MIKVIPAKEEDLNQMKLDMQEAFQIGYEEKFGKCEGIILPLEDIEQSLKTYGAIAYKAIEDDKILGGAIVVINENKHNDLHLLYVKVGVQSKGIGKIIWDSIEGYHKDTLTWSTCTPIFENRNIYFYVNKCGFHVVKVVRELNIDGFIGDNGEGMYEFKKYMHLKEE